MRTLPLVLAVGALLASNATVTHAQPLGTLRVIRTTPGGGQASPLAEIRVTFDRPIAGSIDRVVDPATIFKIQPALAGKLEWRDPVTIRFKPDAPMAPGSSYTVTILPNFQAMDGSALSLPYQYTFRVQGPTLLGGLTVTAGNGGTPSIRPDHRFIVVYSTAVDLDRLSAGAMLEFGAACTVQRTIKLRATGQRTLGRTDSWQLQEAGGWQRERAADTMRRVIQLVPETPLPRGCRGELVLPNEADAQAERGYARWTFYVFDNFRLTGFNCASSTWCPNGPLHVSFSSPVKGAEVLRHVRTLPEVKFTIRDTTSEATDWYLEGDFRPRTNYAVVVDTSLQDVTGQKLNGNPAAAYRTTGFAPSFVHPFGNLVVERNGLRTLTVQHINIDTLVAVIAPIPDSLEGTVMSRYGWTDDSLWTKVSAKATTQRYPIRATQDRAMLTSIHLPATNAQLPGTSTLYAVRASGIVANSGKANTFSGITLVQVTNLGVHVRLGVQEGAVWVTSLTNGQPVGGALAVLYSPSGKRLASSTTDAQGIARLAGWQSGAQTSGGGGDSEDEGEGYGGGIEGYVKVTYGADRAIAAVNQYDPDLSPWHFGVSDAWGDGRIPVAGGVFTERGIYRPGERVYAKAIVRDGALGALRVPAAGDTIRWRFYDRESAIIKDVKMRLSAFGTSEQTFDIPALSAIGYYRLDVQVKRLGEWRTIGSAGYRIAEYRPPEFLVDLASDTLPLFPGDTAKALLQARYLFGAPMGRAEVVWTARRSPVSAWGLSIPGTDGWNVGPGYVWGESGDSEQEFASGTDTLDVRGERTLRIPVAAGTDGQPQRITIETGVTDINRQAVGRTTSFIMHPADFYIAARPTGEGYFWTAGQSRTIDVIAVRPNGERISGVAIAGIIARREWHRVRRERNGVAEEVGEWVVDTVATCNVTSASAATPCTFTPQAGGVYSVGFTAKDSQGRVARTSFTRWVTGSDWVPWNDESQFKMDVIPDRERYAVGDTASVLFASPFVDAEAWITVEREGIIQQRRVRLTSGTTTLKFPITEAFAPNAFISIIVARGRSAAPGPLDDPGRPTIRVGYASLRVTPEVKRLSISLAPGRTEYRPGDTARVSIAVKDAASRGQRSEVTLWAVDEGVLALTDYRTPDPIDLIYRERGLGMRLRSNMTNVAPQVPEGEKGKRDPGGGGGAAGADVLRSQFKTTAFFLGSVVTDVNGNAVATAKLPDNLTTFRLMAVAVTAGDRYGKGQSSLLVTRPLLARQALPRFVRPGDDFIAGAVINRRDGAATPVTVRADVAGVTMTGNAIQSATLAASRGVEVRFPFKVARTDTSATFRFDVTSVPPRDSDAVRVTIPVRPDYHPRTFTVAGVLRDTSSVEMILPAGIDPARSRLALSFGASPLGMIRGIAQTLRVYPYYCTEQVTSVALPLIALLRAQRQSSTPLVDRDPTPDINRAVEMLTRRQRGDGGIGYWSSNDWTTPWLSAYAGNVLLDARDAGVAVDSMMLERLAGYLQNDLRGRVQRAMSPVSNWYDLRYMRLRDQVASVDFLSRMRRPDVASENELIRMAAMLSVEDRARLAEVVMRRNQRAVALQLMNDTWNALQIEGRRAVIPDSANPEFYFGSRVRPISRILTSTLAIDPQHRLIAPLTETLLSQSKASRASWMWNTQDYASAVTALTAIDRILRPQAQRTVTVQSGGRTVLESAPSRGESTVPLTGLLAPTAEGQALRVALDGGAGDGSVFYFLTVTEIPTVAPVIPEDRGIKVERWYERYDNGAPTTSATEGELVRVRLRVTVPSTRQFVVLDDALPAGLEAIDLSLRTASALPGPGGSTMSASREDADAQNTDQQWAYGYWDSGWWSPFDHREIRDDRVVYSATMLWAGTYTATYLARATSAGTFTRPPAHAEEMYNPAVHGRSDGGTFVVKPRGR